MIDGGGAVGGTSIDTGRSALLDDGGTGGNVGVIGEATTRCWQAACSATAKSSVRAKRAFGSLESALKTTSSTEAGSVGICSFSGGATHTGAERPILVASPERDAPQPAIHRPPRLGHIDRLLVAVCPDAVREPYKETFPQWVERH